jgi:hypothetical protein
MPFLNHKQFQKNIQCASVKYRTHWLLTAFYGSLLDKVRAKLLAFSDCYRIPVKPGEGESMKILVKGRPVIAKNADGDCFS